MSDPIRILHVFASVNRGGAESRTMDIYRHIDREKVQFDFLVNVAEAGHFAAEIQALGGRIYQIPRFRLWNYFSYRRTVAAFFREHPGFHAVHGHITTSAGIYLPLAKAAGIPLTIAHARTAGVDPGLKGILTRLLHLGLHRKADYLFACSQRAGLMAFGRKAGRYGRISHIPNAIDSARFDYDEAKRVSIRRSLGLEDAFVLGHVGNFLYPKNHPYLLKVFHEVQKVLPDSRLLLVGGGPGEKDIRAQAEALGVAEKIIYAGVVDNPEDYYMAFDYFVFPSHYEGMPGAVIEAQTAGLRCLISDSISDEVIISNLATAMSITAEAPQWAEQIIKTKDYPRMGRAETIRAAGFDAPAQARTMEEFYLSQPKQMLMLIVPTLEQGGFERICVKTARLLSPYYEVMVVVFDSSIVAYDVSGLHLIDICRGARPGKAAKLMNILIRARKLKQLKRLHIPDAAYSFGPGANIVNVLSKIRQGKAWVGFRHFMDVEGKWTNRLVLSKADLQICCSQAIAQELVRRYRFSNTRSLYNPCDVAEILRLSTDGEAKWPWPDDDGAIHLMAMAREDDYKGYWHTLKVFYLAQQEMPQLRLSIIGGGTFAEYRQLAAELGIAETVHFTGALDNPFSYLKQGAVFLMMSIAEGFPNAMLEAMALGLAVVATDCPTGPAEILTDSPEVGGRDRRARCPHRAAIRGPESRASDQETGAIWGKYGVLLPPMDSAKNLDPNHITKEERHAADVVVRLLKDPTLLKKYQKAASVRAEDFSCEAYVRQLLSLFPR